MSCMSDFPNSTGKSHFVDHVDFLMKTITIIKNLKNYNWIFRPHPFEHKFGDKTKLSNYYKKILQNGNFLFPPKGNINDVFKYSDCVITPQGSAGFEFTSFKKKVVVSKYCHYSNWNFVRCANSLDEYKKLLTNIEYMDPPDNDSVNKALIYTSLRAMTISQKNTKNYFYPHGRIGNKLWLSIPHFLKKNKSNIIQEAKLISEWIKSDYQSYSVYKNILNYE